MLRDESLDQQGIRIFYKSHKKAKEEARERGSMAF